MSTTAATLETRETRDPVEAREATLGSREFDRIAELIHDRAGIVLSAAKRQMVTSRLQRRLRALGMASFEEYVALVEDARCEEHEHFVNALTTNLTSFFREPHHFEHLAGPWLEHATAGRPSGTLRVWSAGCSTGEEPYSVVMALLEVLPTGWDLKVLATDLDSQVVATAEAGVYRSDRVQGLPITRLRRFFQRGTGTNEGQVRVSAEVRRHVTFRRLNLLRPWPMRGHFDAIFCRNVVIYFSKETQRPLFDRFADRLVPGGHLYIGHSETLHRVSERFEPLGRTIYRKGD